MHQGSPGAPHGRLKAARCKINIRRKQVPLGRGCCPGPGRAGTEGAEQKGWRGGEGWGMVPLSRDGRLMGATLAHVIPLDGACCNSKQSTHAPSRLWCMCAMGWVREGWRRLHGEGSHDGIGRRRCRGRGAPAQGCRSARRLLPRIATGRCTVAALEAGVGRGHCAVMMGAGAGKGKEVWWRQSGNFGCRAHRRQRIGHSRASRGARCSRPGGNGM
ncbi:MAG: hypothetical protein J3K34DRAFT_432619 [Monoraphidium minutum]|nr:MAG: hypothetical protein J3K34DRAFT_432619 [Monoraphidium minutum]